MIVVDGANVKYKYEETYGDAEGMHALEVVYKFWQKQFERWRIPSTNWQVIIVLKRSWSNIKAAQHGGGLMDTENTAALERLKREAPGVIMEIPDGHRDNDDSYIIRLACDNEGFIISDDRFRDHLSCLSETEARHVRENTFSFAFGGAAPPRYRPSFVALPFSSAFTSSFSSTLLRPHLRLLRSFALFFAYSYNHLHLSHRFVPNPDVLPRVQQLWQRRVDDWHQRLATPLPPTVPVPIPAVTPATLLQQPPQQQPQQPTNHHLPDNRRSIPHTNQEIRLGDWYCPRCGANVFASKVKCFRCSTPKPSASGINGGSADDKSGYARASEGTRASRGDAGAAVAAVPVPSILSSTTEGHTLSKLDLIRTGAWVGAGRAQAAFNSAFSTASGGSSSSSSTHQAVDEEDFWGSSSDDKSSGGSHGPVVVIAAHNRYNGAMSLLIPRAGLYKGLVGWLIGVGGENKKRMQAVSCTRMVFNDLNADGIDGSQAQYNMREIFHEMVPDWNDREVVADWSKCYTHAIVRGDNSHEDGEHNKKDAFAALQDSAAEWTAHGPRF
jgi:hypothetical protein